MNWKLPILCNKSKGWSARHKSGNVPSVPEFPFVCPRIPVSLFIIESLSFPDEARRREGRILRDILRLSNHKVHYVYLRTKRELETVLDQFQDPESRYLHISSHGDRTSIGLTLDNIRFEEFGQIVAPCLRGRRLFMSACEVVNSELAKCVLPGTGCYSLIDPRHAINFDDAVVMWEIRGPVPGFPLAHYPLETREKSR